jgi:hypothetical protein
MCTSSFRIGGIDFDEKVFLPFGDSKRVPQAIGSRIARTCSIVVLGLTKHRRATFSPRHKVGCTNAICSSSNRRH